MQEDMKSFMRLLCTISATMASVSFFGVSVIMSIYFNLPENVPASAKAAWLNAANTGIVAVVLFAFTSLSILFSLFPKMKEEKRSISAIMRQIIKRERLLRIAETIQRFMTAISNWFTNWFKENAISFLLLIFLFSWFAFFVMTGFLYSAFNV